MCRRLDAAVAEGLGYEVRTEELKWGTQYWRKGEYINNYLPKYSTDGNAMLELIVEMQKRGWKPSVIGKMAKFRREDGFAYSVMANTLPLAVALAAYKALTGKEWAE